MSLTAWLRLLCASHGWLVHGIATVVVWQQVRDNGRVTILGHYIGVTARDTGDSVPISSLFIAYFKWPFKIISTP